MNQKPDHYYYNPLSNQTRALFKKVSKQKPELKGVPWQKLWANYHSMHSALDSFVIICENVWLKRPVVLQPDNTHLIDDLERTNFEGVLEQLHCTYSQFSIAIPKSATFNGEIIKGVFVSLYTLDEFGFLVEKFSKEHNANINSEKTKEGHIQFIMINYFDPLENGASITLSVAVRDLKNILNTTTMEEYKAICREGGNESVWFADLTEKEARTQFSILRFVLSLIVYMTAVPSSVSDVSSFKKPAKKGDAHFVVHTIKGFNTDKDRKRMEPHFRNLRHEKFYQNEYATMPPGTRWVPVGMDLKEVEN